MPKKQQSKTKAQKPKRQSKVGRPKPSAPKAGIHPGRYEDGGALK